MNQFIVDDNPHTRELEQPTPETKTTNEDFGWMASYI